VEDALFTPLFLVLFLFDFTIFAILKKTILKYQNVKKANEREKVGEQGQEESGNNFGEKTYSECGKLQKSNGNNFKVAT